MNNKKSFLILLLIALAAAFFWFGGHHYLTLDSLKQQQSALNEFYQTNPAKMLLSFFLVYVIVTALSLPGAVIMTLAGGALFGLFTGLILVSFASTIGATLAFLASRFLFRSSVETKFKAHIQTINDGLEKEGAFYLFTLRLIPVFPFFLINLVMGLTSLKTRVFYVVSQVGMLAGTFVFVNAGTQLAQLESLSDVLSPGLILSFALLGLLPLIANKIVNAIKARKVYANYQKPETFDQNLVVIGAGSGGLVSAYIAAAVKAQVTLIEKHKMGGDCLNTGCVPSKALIKQASIAHAIRDSERFGIDAEINHIDFKASMARVHDVIAKIEPHDSVERYSALGVNCIQGEAFIRDPWRVEVNGKVITTKSIIIASGARPFVPPIEGLTTDDYLTSDTLWQLDEKPEKLLVLGGGPIGSELSQAFVRLGVDVTQIEMMPRLLGREDEEVSGLVHEQFEKDGITLHLNSKAVRVERDDSGKKLICERDGKEFAVEFDQLLVAIGRTANVDGFGLEELGVNLNPNRTIETNGFLETNFPNILAVGDVAGPYQFTHVAAHQAWYASVNALFGSFKKFRADYRVIPFATFTHPEIARVGLNETEAVQQGIAFDVTRYDIDDLDRAIADGNDEGFVKVLTVPGKDKILGATIVGAHAGDLLAEFVLAMKYNLGLNKILGTIHIYPTMSEANKYLAGQWKQKNKPEGLLRFVEKLHKWCRGT